MGIYLQIGGSLEDKLNTLRDIGWQLGFGRGGDVKLDYEAEVKAGRKIIALVDNGAFQAVGIAYDKLELERMNHRNDTRYRAYFAVDVGTIRGMMTTEEWREHRDSIRKDIK